MTHAGSVEDFWRGNEWPSGALRRYESMGSFGAKFCLLNNIRPSRFIHMLKKLAGDFPNRKKVFATVLEPDFPIERFAKMLNEPLEMVRSMAAEEFVLSQDLVSRIHAPIWQTELLICRKCLRDGYHSTLNQMTFFRRCLIHGCELIRPSTSARNVSGYQTPSDLQQISPLMELYSAPQGEFQLRRKVIHGDFKRVPRMPDISACIGNACKKFSKWPKLPLDGEDQSHSLVYGEDWRRLVASGFRVVGEGGSWLNRAVPMPKTVITAEIDVSSTEVDGVRDALRSHVDRWERNYHRMLVCHQRRLSTPWHLHLDACFTEFIRGHEGCASAFGKMLKRLSVFKSQSLLVSPAWALFSEGFPICACLVALDMLAHTFSPMHGQIRALAWSNRYQPWPSWGKGASIWFNAFAVRHRFFHDWSVTWSGRRHCTRQARDVGFLMKKQEPALSSLCDAWIDADLRGAAIAAAEAMRTLERGPGHNAAIEVWAAYKRRVRALSPVVCLRGTIAGLAADFELPFEPKMPAILDVSARHISRSSEALDRVLKAFPSTSVERYHSNALDETYMVNHVPRGAEL